MNPPKEYFASNVYFMLELWSSFLQADSCLPSHQKVSANILPYCRGIPLIKLDMYVLSVFDANLTIQDSFLVVVGTVGTSSVFHMSEKSRENRTKIDCKASDSAANESQQKFAYFSAKYVVLCVRELHTQKPTGKKHSQSNISIIEIQRLEHWLKHDIICTIEQFNHGNGQQSNCSICLLRSFSMFLLLRVFCLCVWSLTTFCSTFGDLYSLKCRHELNRITFLVWWWHILGPNPSQSFITLNVKPN